MRFPLDLIIALLMLDAVRRGFPPLTRENAQLFANEYFSTGFALLTLSLYWLVIWLAHEGLARRTEWLMRFGRHPAGVPDGEGRPPRLHPLEFHTRGAVALQVLSVLLYTLFLFGMRWPLRTAAWPEWLGLQAWAGPQMRNLLSESNFVRGVLELGPYLGAMVVGWLPKYRLTRWLGRRDASLMSYLSLEVRMTFLPCLLWLAVGLIEDLLVFGLPRATLLDLRDSGLLALLNVLFIILVGLVVVPWAIVRFWNCRPLPEGELKERLLALQARSGVRARAILSWNLKGSAMANACVLGPWASMRYILITPGLIEMLTPDECEAVIAHELGHARYGHLGILMALMVGMLSAAVVVLALTRIGNVYLETLLLAGLILLSIRGGLGLISRAFEREADLSSAELLGTPLPLIAALEKLGQHSGQTRHIYTWHHDSIATRVGWLERIGCDPQAMRAYHGRMRRMRLGLCGFALIALALAIFLGAEKEDSEPPARRPQEGAGHAGATSLDRRTEGAAAARVRV